MDAVPPDFAVALKTGRFIRGFTLRELAERSRVPPWRISGFERRRAVPSANEFTALWHALTSNPPPPPAREPSPSPTEKAKSA
jgi:hypothetical protein